jgi:hypothetical protein
VVAFTLPLETTQFANVDRAMNLYFRGDWGSSELTVVRALPDGTIAGGGRIQEVGCRLSWRQYYIDLAGTVWTLCITDKGASVKRYILLDMSGQPLPAVAPKPADVIWRPGAETQLAKG